MQDVTIDAEIDQARSSFDGLAGVVVDLFAALGEPGVGLAILLEVVVPPIPSEAVLPLAGFASTGDQVAFVAVVAWATAGSVVGALLLYGLGAWLGVARVEALWGRVPLSDPDDVRRAVALFERHGDVAVLGGRVLPFVRSAVSVPAGVAGMPLGRFVVLTAIGSGAWNVALVGAGRVLGDRWTMIAPWLGWFGWIVVAACLAAGAVLVARRLRDRTSPSERAD